MDANKLRFHLLADRAHWGTAEDGEAHAYHYDDSRRMLRLASARKELPTEAVLDDQELTQWLSRTPGTIDAFGTWAYGSDDGKPRIVAAGAGPEPTTIEDELERMPTDLAMGHDEILYVASEGRVTLCDVRGRWERVHVEGQSDATWRLAADPRGGAYVLGGPPTLGSSQEIRVTRVLGRPVPRGLVRDYDPGVFRPRPENPDPPRLIEHADGPVPGEIPVGISTDPEGHVTVLSWVMDAAAAAIDPDQEAWARLRFVHAGELGPPIVLVGVRRPFSFAWLDADRIVVLAHVQAGAAVRVEGIAYWVDRTLSSWWPLGDYLPLSGHDGGPLLNGTTWPPHVPRGKEPPQPVHAISLPAYETTAVVENALGVNETLEQRVAAPIDAGTAGAVWHRLYVEASLPPRCGLRVFLAATDSLQRPPWSERARWHEHVFGELEATSGVPRGAWLPVASEVPFHSGLLRCAPETGRRGLFTALIQRSGRRVRTLRGRYLWVRVELCGDGRSTPELAALRAYASRFSYAEHYLPEMYRESVFGDEADEEGDATPTDFLERFLGIMEGVMTPLEDRIADAHVLMDPRTVPEASLTWLASWVGLCFDPALPVERRRALLQAAPRIRRGHGTLAGLSAALDAATGGAVTRGALVIVEDFRLRRVFATIIGADFEDEDEEDPLLPGLHASGNSFVGDTLFLGDEGRLEFLALFGAEVSVSAGERAAVEQFFERLAHRVTILAHQELAREDLGLVRRIAEIEAPAHVAVSVVTARHPFMVGVASLVGVDSSLGPPERNEPVRVGVSVLGVRGVLERPPSLDPRLRGGG